MTILRFLAFLSSFFHSFIFLRHFSPFPFFDSYAISVNLRLYERRGERKSKIKRGSDKEERERNVGIKKEIPKLLAKREERKRKKETKKRRQKDGKERKKKETRNKEQKEE